MKGSAVAAFVTVAAITACGRTELAVQPPTVALAAQAERMTFPFSFTFPQDFISPCTGEPLSGSATFAGETQRVTDSQGGIHFQIDATRTGTYTGEAGTTFTESGTARFHFNLLSSGTMNRVELVNGQITGSDGTTLLLKDRFIFVMDANGVVRIDRDNYSTALRCAGPGVPVVQPG
ncbi:hypothetical protein [Deinococcus apachensis]|uniref:hypothetical protein n=1 Tax=Deinococcus apachensis TaxID=309886 RepID=UPI0003691ABE|nr:hypothetical protein [Deinococcus apachensis]